MNMVSWGIYPRIKNRLFQFDKDASLKQIVSPQIGWYGVAGTSRNVTTSAEVVERVHSKYLYLTALFVIVGIMRYLQIAFVQKESGSPTRIVLQDHFMQLTLLGWIITFAWILY